MAMEQLQVTKQNHSASWVQIFKHDVSTLEGSQVFVKQFTALSFSIITYMRSIFPEFAYTEKELDDVKVKILSGSYECKDAYLMTKWIRSAFDALDNCYMRELVLEILSPDDSPLEYYAIGYKYTEDGPTCSLSANSKILNYDKDKFENSTKKLINSLLTITENLEPLPKKYKLQLRINYYDEGTPYHYKPKFFSHSKRNNLEKLEMLKKKSMGYLETPYHSISIYSGSSLLALDDSQQSFCIEPEMEAPAIELVKVKDYTEAETQTLLKNIDQIETKNQPNLKTNYEETKKKNDEVLQSNSNWTWTNDKSASQDEAVQMPESGEIHEHKLHCICSQDYETDNSFKCEHCESLHHLVCYKISTLGKLPDNGCCYGCAKLDSNIECTDLTLMKYKPRQAKHLAIYRQVLYKCHGMKNINPKTLHEMNVPDELVNIIIAKLQEEKFIRCINRSKNIYKINKVKLAHFYKLYFSK